MDICICDITELECLRAMSALGSAGVPLSKETQLTIPAGKKYGQSICARVKGCGSTSPRVHAVFPHNEARPRLENVVYHSYSEPTEGERFIDFGSGVAGLSIEHFYVTICRRLSFVQRLLLAYELCGWYTIAPNPNYQEQVDQGIKAFKTVARERAPLSTIKKLRDFAKANPQIRGAGLALKALRYAADNARSPQEAKLAIAMSLPYHMGGYNRGPLLMDYLVEGAEGLRRCDTFLLDGSVDVEYGSTLHHSGAHAMQADSQRANELAALGISVVNITSKELRDPKLFHVAMQHLARIQHGPLRIRTKDFESRRDSLWAQLFPQPTNHMDEE